MIYGYPLSTESSHKEATMSKFVTAENPRIGDLVWHMDGAGLYGPHYIIDIRDTGYGSNRRKLYVLFDTEDNSYHYCERRWLKVPKEVQ